MGLIHQFKGKITGQALKLLSQEGQEEAVKKYIPVLLRFLTTYFRLKIEGLDYIPKKGPAIIVANHSGVTALDAVLLGHLIYQHKLRVPRIIAHRLWFAQSRVGHLARMMGLVEANKEVAGEHLKKGQLIILFPEGEAGNFKPTSKAYHLREFKRGFVRLALQLKVPVIPVAIVGAEEANINLREIKTLKESLGITIPLPLNIVPLPSKWHMRIMAPPKWSVDPEFTMAGDDPRMKVLAHRVRKNIMHEIHKMVIERGGAFI